MCAFHETSIFILFLILSVRSCARIILMRIFIIIILLNRTFVQMSSSRVRSVIFLESRRMSGKLVEREGEGRGSGGLGAGGTIEALAGTTVPPTEHTLRTYSFSAVYIAIVWFCGRV